MTRQATPRYQTVFARHPGSVAAPTAGLHFSAAVFEALAAKGISWVDLTLHVGAGTFRPIEADEIGGHVMHAEWAELAASAAEALLVARRGGAGSWPWAPRRRAPWRQRPRPAAASWRRGAVKRTSSSGLATSFTGWTPC